MVSDDAGALRMFGIPKHPRVNPGTLLSTDGLKSIMNRKDQDYFSHLPDDVLWSAEHKYDVIIDEVFGRGRFELSALMKGLLLLNWHRNGGSLSIKKIDIAQRRDLLRAFMKPPGLFLTPETGRRMPDLSEERYISLLRRGDVFEAAGQVDFDRGAEFCVDFLKNEPPV